MFLINYHRLSIYCQTLVNRDSSIRHGLTIKLSIFVCCGRWIISGQNRRKPWFLRKYPPSLMKKDGVRYRHFIDCRVGFILDLYEERYAEERLRCEEKIASGVLPPCIFVPYPVSQEARKYDFKVCEWYCVEEEELADALNKSRGLNENWYVKLDSCICDLSIARRLGGATRNSVLYHIRLSRKSCKRM